VSGEPVALKVLATERVEEGLARAAFRTEIQAQSRLDHPRIVRVRGHGFVRPAEAGPQLPSGAAWLAMDLAPLGSLDRYAEPLSWGGIRGVLLALLDALAHAHARGLVHRDLKAANLLVFRRATEPGGAPEVRITDFGLAHAVGGRAGGRARLGTPRAMAPEQFRGTTADHGPWTDLYAVGCLTWELVCGEPLFPGKDPGTQRRAHLLQEPRPLPADLHVPPGLDEWLRRCLAKTPEARFRFAADAAHALLALPEAGARPERLVALEGLTTLPVEESASHTLAWALDPLEEPSGPVPALPSVEPLLPEVPPCPRSWRAVGAATASAAGLSLFGLRRRPVVGRHAERDAAWSALLSVRSTHAPRAIVVSGPGGVGCSRLASWVGERWHEVGGGPVVRVDCGAGASLERAVQRLLGVSGLPPDAARTRTRVVLQRQGVTDPYEADSLLRLLRVAPPDDDAEGFSSEEERWAVVLRALRRAEPGRVPVLTLDDAHRDPEALAFAGWLLGRPAAAVAVVLTVPDEPAPAGEDSGASLAGPRRAAAWEAAPVLGHARTVHLALRPLDAIDHTALLRVLGLSGSLAAAVAERSAGTPLLAVQLVEEMVRTGRVVETAAGLRAAPGVAGPLPADAGSVWAARVARVRAACADDERPALWLGALLGVEVSREVWDAACAASGRALPPRVADLLCAEGLWEARAWGWVCAHALAQEALLDAVPREGRAALHAACADALAEAGGDVPGRTVRIGRHRLAAGQAGAAFPVLVEAARDDKARGSLDSALRLTRTAERALAEAGAGADDPRRAELGVLEAQLLRLRGRPDAALRRLHPAARVARRQGMGALLAAALRLEGALARQRGELLRATELLREARGRSAAEGDAAGEARAVLDLARVAHRQGRTDDADVLARTGLSLARRARRPRAVAAALRSLAGVARLRGDIDGAVALARSSRDAAVAVHDRLGEAGGLVALGRAAEAGGEPEAARALFHQAADLYETVGSPEAHVARLHMARTLSDEARFADARALVEDAGAAFARLGRRGGLAAVDVLRLSLDAQAREWSAWRLHLRRARRLLRSTGLVDPDLALGLERAAERAAEAGGPGAGADALDLAAHLWGALGDARRAERCRASARGTDLPLPG
jgi:tetratricopeptide (TPR) repeat protein